MMRRKPARSAGSVPSKNSRTFMSSKSNARLPSEPLISIRMPFLRPSAKRVASKLASAPPVNRPRNSAASSTVTVPVPSPATPPNVPDVPQPPLGDQLAGQPHGRHPAIGEADHGADAVAGGAGGGLGHRLGLGDGVGQRLLAQHVLAGLERRDRDLGVGRTRGADVDKVDVVAL